MEKTVKPLGRGDIILVSNDPKPSNNREQKGTRPWLVVSSPFLNASSPFVWAIPFTSTYRGYPLTFDWTNAGPNTTTKGTLLCNQMAALDVTHRQYKLLEHVEVPKKVDYIIKAVLGYN